MRIQLPFNLGKLEIRREFSSRYSNRPTLMGGGIVNPLTGMGLSADKSEHSFFTPTRVHWRGELEVLRVQSWAARKYIEIPVDDMFIRWREWQKGEGQGVEAAVEAMEEAESRHQVESNLSQAMKAARLFGTGLLVMVTKDGDPTTPLDPKRIRQGDLVNLLVFDRFDATLWDRDDDVMSPTYGLPLGYDLHPSRGLGFRVHHSRVLRFDGISSLSTDGWTIYDRDWGVSEIVPAILSILQDQSVATGAAHLSQEASIPVLAVDGLREALAGGARDPNEPSAEEIGNQINQFKSIYRLLLMDKTETFERVSVSWAGMADIMDRFNRRLAATAGIPATRFWGASPVGMNATGDSDMVNYAHHVAAMRSKLVTDPLARLDEVLMRDAGVLELPEYTWPSLIDMSDTELAEIAERKSTIVKTLIENGVITEDEGRAMLDGDPIIGELEGEAPGIPDPVLPPMPSGGNNA